MSSCSKTLYICTKGKACPRNGASDLRKALKKIIKKQDLEDFYQIKKSGCFGLCRFAPTFCIDNVLYGGELGKSDYKKILKHHSKKPKPVKPVKSLQVSKKK